MKLMFLLAFPVSIISLNAAETTTKKDDYINKYLPNDSLVRIIHNKEPRGTGWFGYDSSKRSACDKVESALQNLFSTLKSAEQNGCLNGTYTITTAFDGPRWEYSFREYFLYYLMKGNIDVIVDCDRWGKNDILAESELKKTSDALSPQWALAEKLTQALEEKLKRERDTEQAKEITAAYAAILAHYNK